MPATGDDLNDRAEDFKASSMKDAGPIRQTKLEKVPVKLLRIPAGESKRIIPHKEAV